MRVLRRIVPALAATVALHAADAAAMPPVQLRIADGAALVAGWDASIYAKIWADPAAAPLRQACEAEQAGMRERLGFDPLAALAAAKGFAGAFAGMDGPDRPQIRFRVDLGDFAAKIIERIAASSAQAKPMQVAGADQAIGDADAVLARFGTVLAFALHCQPEPQAPAGAAAAHVAVDLDAKRLVDAVAAAVPAADKAEFDRAVQGMRSLLGRWAYRGDLVPEGIRERLSGDVPTPGSLPVDRTVLGRLPATTLMAAAWGFDGRAYWKAEGEALLGQLDGAMHPGAPVGAVATAEEVAQLLRGMGIEVTLQEIVEGLTGTSLVAVTQSMPFPALSIALPRSAALDRLLGFAMAQIQGTLPDEGQSAPIIIPGVPIPVAITLLRAKDHWLLTTDLMLADAWAGGAPGGFDGTAMARTLSAAAPANASLLGASDTPAVLRTIQSMLGLFLAANDALSPEEKQAINTALIRLAGEASTGYVWSAATPQSSTAEVRGLIGSGVVPGVIGAAIAGIAVQQRMGGGDPLALVPMDGGDASTPDQEAIDTLSAVLFPAQFQFQAAAFADQDGDGIGEYATFAELAGAAAPPGRDKAEALLNGFAADGVRNGYRYAVFLPDGAGGALPPDAGPRRADRAAADRQEATFVIYAWPVQPGGRMFAVDQGGVVYEATSDGSAPAWNTLYGGQGWDAVPAWQPAQR